MDLVGDNACDSEWDLKLIVLVGSSRSLTINTIGTGQIIHRSTTQAGLEFMILLPGPPSC